MKPTKESLKAVFLGTIGINEPKSRAFWDWHDNETFICNEQLNGQFQLNQSCPDSDKWSTISSPPIIANDTV